MFEDQIKSLFSSEEYAHFLNYMDNEHYFWEKNRFCHSGYILGFISSMEDENRKEEIISVCINSYPQIIGLAPGN